MVSCLMTLIQDFNHCSILLLFPAPPPFSSSSSLCLSLSLSLQGGDFTSISLLSHWIFHKSTFSPPLNTHTHTLLTFSRMSSHFHSLTLLTTVIFPALPHLPLSPSHFLLFLVILLSILFSLFVRPRCLFFIPYFTFFFPLTSSQLNGNLFAPSYLFF